MKSPDSVRSPRARRLLTIQTVAGVALLALAVPYSGCFTSRVWNPDTVLIASKIEGRTKFEGHLGDRYENVAGDIAYPGKMDFVKDDGATYSEQGWLIVPGSLAEAWRKEISGYADTPNGVSGFVQPAYRDDGVFIAVNPKPRPQALGAYYSPSKFLEAEQFLFHTKDSGFEPEKSGFRRMPSPGLLPPESIGIVSLFYPDRRFTLDYNPVQRTGWSDTLNVGGKVLMTPVTVAGDVAIVGGVIAGGAVFIVVGPVVLAGKAIGKAFESKPEKTGPAKNDTTVGNPEEDDVTPDGVREK